MKTKPFLLFYSILISVSWILDTNFTRNHSWRYHTRYKGCGSSCAKFKAGSRHKALVLVCLDQHLNFFFQVVFPKIHGFKLFVFGKYWHTIRTYFTPTHQKAFCQKRLLFFTLFLGENIRLDGKFVSWQISRLDDDFDPAAEELNKYYFHKYLEIIFFHISGQ